VCCIVLQCVAVCCSVLQCVAVFHSVLQCVAFSLSLSKNRLGRSALINIKICIKIAPRLTRVAYSATMYKYVYTQRKIDSGKNEEEKKVRDRVSWTRV